MARKTALVTIEAEGRDQGKTFLLQEMPASQAESWAVRVILAAARGGVEIPDDIAQAGLAGVAAMGLKMLGGMHFEDAKPLMDEMFTCVKIVPDSSKPQVVRYLIEDDIEEVVTRLKLRKEVFALHTDFFTIAAG
jgi:hypothetical protein